MELFTGFAVELSSGEVGVIEGGFGQSGKVKIRVSTGLLPDTQEQLKKGKKGEVKSTPSSPIRVKLQYKRYIYDTKKAMTQ